MIAALLLIGAAIQAGLYVGQGGTFHALAAVLLAVAGLLHLVRRARKTSRK